MNWQDRGEEGLKMLCARHSVRAFEERGVAEDILRELKADITMANTHVAGLHFTLITDDPDPFRGFSKSYGVFRNVRNYLACVVDTSFPDYREKAGFYAEQFAVKATSLGLGTCFVGGTYDASSIKVQLRADWKILFVVVFGHPLDNERPLARLMTRMLHRKDPDARSFFAGTDSEYREACDLFPWLPTALEALACAPSSLNKRPVKIAFRKEGSGSTSVGNICAYVDASNPKNLSDLGIAKYNMSAVMPEEGIWEWGNNAPFLL